MVELLSPVGDFDCLKAAVQNGADAVYFGSDKFNARQNATNFDDISLKEAIQYAKLRNVKINFALNTLIKDDEFNDAANLVKKVYEYGVDAIIVQDLGLAKYIIKNFPDIDVHASTQMTIHNLDGVLKLQELGFKRVVLSRELSLHEIEYICSNSNIEIECFMHGALCICYSGQCLLSSSIGARSGNRGKCAQPCRLPYKLYEQNSSNNKLTQLDNGYLLSTRDFCSLEYLPSLINAGVTSFKIEGRMKTPEYVATCTRIYRKYIDLALSHKQYKIDEVDLKNLMQVFNRGSFSTGNLIEEPNKEYVFKEKPNNMGLYIGNVSKINPNKGLISLKTREKLNIGDKVSFQKEEHKYTISELMKNNQNVPYCNVNDLITIGRMKGNINLGDKIYKLSSQSYSNEIHQYYNRENIKIPLVACIRIKKGQNICLEVTSKDSYTGNYFSMSAKSETNIMPIDAISSPISKERISEQLRKTNDTPFEFESIIYDMDDNVYIPKISAINELRRNVLSSLVNQAINRFTRKSINTDINANISISNKYSSKIALFLETLNTHNDYSNLDFRNINYVYIPFEYFLNKSYEDVILKLSNYVKLYVYLPHILKDNFRNIFFNNFENIIHKYNVYGVVVSNLSNLTFLKDYVKKLDIVANYTFNVFNYHTIHELNMCGCNSRVCLSPELDKNSLQKLSEHSEIDTELLVYGRLRLMTCGYCLLGTSNLCYPNCKMLCRKKDSKFYLNDRLNMNFRIIPDNIQTINTIYNSRITSINYMDIKPSVVRISILDESIEKINEIISNVKNDICYTGDMYTKGNLNKFV